MPSESDIEKRRKGGLKPSINVGDTFFHTNYGQYDVIAYLNAHAVTIKFRRTGYEFTLSASEIKKNQVRDHTQVRVYGVGINDANYIVIEKTRKGRGAGNKKKCPFWTKWVSMLERCYSNQMLVSYKDTVVCEEWLLFSNFKSWMEKQNWQGKDLDKDLLGDGNMYSPETCCFIDKKLNSFLVSCNKVSCGKSQKDGKFQVRCNNPFSENKEKGRYLGLFDTEEDAHRAWKAKKHEYACQLADLQDDERVAKALRGKFL